MNRRQNDNAQPPGDSLITPQKTKSRHSFAHKTGNLLMTASPYDTKSISADDIDAPLTNVHASNVPQTGVHLYHFPLSFYSQIAQLALAEKNIRWVSHPVLIIDYEQYNPAYVRINPRCVVPTLVIDGKITTDAFNICSVVDEYAGGLSLTPKHPEEQRCVADFRALGRDIFVEALSYGTVPDFKRPWLLRRFSGKNHSAKDPILQRLIKQHKADPFLAAAYEKKRDILQFTERFLHSKDEMKTLMNTVYAAMDKIEHQLKTGPFSKNGWLCSQAYSQADLEWSVMLRRFDFLNLGKILLKTRPLTARYQKKLFARGAFKKAIVAWEHPIRQVFLPILWKKIQRMLGIKARSHS
jgi:glutathione S-transferase